MRESGCHSTLQDFRRARHRADLGHIVAFLKEQSAEVLSHDEVYRQLQTLRPQPRQAQYVPLDAIIGKLSRDKEFHESFFPQRLYNSHELMRGEISRNEVSRRLAPIELYQIGDTYVVSDGNSRLSMALQAGAQVIEAFVTTVLTDTASSHDLHVDEVILNAEYREFVAQTHLDTLRTWRKHELTIPGKYHILEEQLQVCRYLVYELQQRECSDEELVLFWYDTLYLPTITLIGTLEILRDFPERTAGDLYIWVCEHRPLLRHIDSLRSLPYVVETQLNASSQHHQVAIEKIDAQQEYRDFLEHTQLHQVRPEVDIPLTDPQNYHVLRDHIDVHHYFMGLETRHEIPYKRAVTHWYDVVYSPIAHAIRQHHLVEYFPNHSIGDLYLWISAYQIISRRDDVSRAEEFLTETLTALSNFSDEMLDTIIILIEYLDFLLHTQLKVLRPKADLSINIPGKYRVLEEHIKVHRHFMGIEQQREIPYHDAVVHWYDSVYLPTLKIIAEQGILRAFPDLHATSLYLWICEHRSKLEQQMGEPVDIADAAGDLVTHFGSKKSSPLSRRHQGIPEKSNADTVKNQGFRSRQNERKEYALRRQERLFSNLLVPFNARRTGKIVLEQALEIAKREDARIVGLHVLPSEHQLHADGSLKLRSYFEQHCRGAGVEGTLHVEAGNLQEHIHTYCRQCDVIVSLPAEISDLSPIHPLFEHENSSGYTQFLCAETPSLLHNALIAYDNSPPANEALFAGAYLASCWGIALTIMTSGIDAAGRTFIKEYLDAHGLDAVLLQQRGSLQEWLPKMMHEHGCDFLIAGSRNSLYGKPSELSSTDDLANGKYPLLLCR